MIAVISVADKSFYHVLETEIILSKFLMFAPLSRYRPGRRATGFVKFKVSEPVSRFAAWAEQAFNDLINTNADGFAAQLLSLRDNEVVTIEVTPSANSEVTIWINSITLAGDFVQVLIV